MFTSRAVYDLYDFKVSDLILFIALDEWLWLNIFKLGIVWGTVAGFYILSRARFLGKLTTLSASLIVEHSGHSRLNLCPGSWVFLKREFIHFSQRVCPQATRILGI